MPSHYKPAQCTIPTILWKDRKGENGGLREKKKPATETRTFFKIFSKILRRPLPTSCSSLVVPFTNVRWSVRLCPPAGIPKGIVGRVGDWRRRQIYDDSSSSLGNARHVRKLP